MVKSSHLVGLPVVSAGRGLIFGRVRDVSLSLNKSSLWGIKVERSNLMRTCCWIPFNRILLIGDESVLLKPEGKTLKQVPDEAQLLPLKARMVNGEDAGLIQDLWMDEKTGHVESLLLSSSLWDDLHHGRKSIIRYALMDNKQDILVLPEEQHEEDDGFHA